MEPVKEPRTTCHEVRFARENSLALLLNTGCVAIAAGKKTSVLGTKIGLLDAPFPTRAGAGVKRAHATTWNKQVELVFRDTTIVDDLNDHLLAINGCRSGIGATIVG